MSKKQELDPIQADNPEIISGVKRLPEFIKFAEWLATPRQFRETETQKDFAQSIGVNEDTLSDWKKKPEFWNLFQKFLSNWIKERIPDAIGGLYSNACNEGTAKEVETFLRLGGMTINKPNRKQDEKS